MSTVPTVMVFFLPKELSLSLVNKSTTMQEKNLSERGCEGGELGDRTDF